MYPESGQWTPAACVLSTKKSTDKEKTTRSSVVTLSIRPLASPCERAPPIAAPSHRTRTRTPGPSTHSPEPCRYVLRRDARAASTPAPRGARCVCVDRLSLATSPSPPSLSHTPSHTHLSHPQGEDVAAATAALDSMQGEPRRQRRGERRGWPSAPPPSLLLLAFPSPSLLSLTRTLLTPLHPQSWTSSPWSSGTRRRRRRKRRAARAR